MVTYFKNGQKYKIKGWGNRETCYFKPVEQLERPIPGLTRVYDPTSESQGENERPTCCRKSHIIPFLYLA